MWPCVRLIRTMQSQTYRETMSHRLVELSSALLGRRSSPPPPPPPVEIAVPALPEEMICERTDTPTECRLRISGALDLHSAPELRAVFDSVIAAKRPLVILELEGLTMIDSSGVGAIVSLFKRAKASGACVVVKGVQNQPLAVCKLLKLERVFGL